MVVVLLISKKTTHQVLSENVTIVMLCQLGNFACFFCHLLSADFFQNHLFWKILSGIHTIRMSIRLYPDQNVGPDLVPNCL